VELVPPDSESGKSIAIVGVSIVDLLLLLVVLAPHPASPSISAAAHTTVSRHAQALGGYF
jgi:hypothetical protein